MRSNDGEGKPGRKEPLRSDGQALCQSDAIAVSELFVSGLALSVSLRSTAPLVGEPLAKRRSFPLCQGLPSVGEVALRSNDGEVEPGRWHGVSADGEVELLPLWGSCHACGEPESPP